MMSNKKIGQGFRGKSHTIEHKKKMSKEHPVEEPCDHDKCKFSAFNGLARFPGLEFVNVDVSSRKRLPLRITRKSHLQIQFLFCLSFIWNVISLV